MTLVALPPPPSLWKRRALIAGISALALAGMYTLGRYSRPDRTVETATVKQDAKADAHVEEKKDAGETEVAHRVIIKRKRPAPEAPPPPGCPPCAAIDEEETHEDVTASSFDHGTVATDLHVREQAEETHSKVTEYAKPRFRIAFSMAPRAPVDPRAIGVEADVRVFGTLWVGGRYIHTDKTPLRVSVGLEF